MITPFIPYEQRQQLAVLGKLLDAGEISGPDFYACSQRVRAGEQVVAIERSDRRPHARMQRERLKREMPRARGITVKQAARILNTSEDSAQKHLLALYESGEVDRYEITKSRGYYYVLAGSL